MPKKRCLFIVKSAVEEPKGKEMSLKDKIKKESVAALKNGDSRKVEVLRFLVSLLDKKELRLPLGKMTGADEVTVLRRELKNKQEARGMFAKAGRKDLVSEVDDEIVIVKKYLPVQMGEVDVEKIVDEVMKRVEDKNFGKIMGQVMAKVGADADGSLVARIVKAKISE